MVPTNYTDELKDYIKHLGVSTLSETFLKGQTVTPRVRVTLS